MLVINPLGQVVNSRIKLAISANVEREPMSHVHGIIVHQTNGPTADSAFNSYRRQSAYGAHFLIDKDGTIYQTASLFRQTRHVGKLKARCLLRGTCTPAEIVAYSHFNPSGMNTREMAKSPPDRFPSNEDSIGIELVGEALPRNVPETDRVYEAVTAAQNDSLKWLIAGLTATLRVPLTEIFRHPQVSYKNRTEASTAQW
jgi:N-acetyl-anhydromuramyl-L-alanine amidase AmpD